MVWLVCFGTLVGCGGPPEPGERFRDCPECPEMVVIPGGDLLFGSPDSEEGRSADEGPQLALTIQPFAAGRFPVTRGEYAAFIAETERDGAAGATVQPGCFVMQDNGSWGFDPERRWDDPDFEQGDDHPVVCVSWDEAQDYVAWLNARVEGAPYRLLTEAEWEYAARAGSTTPYWWGDAQAEFCGYTNGAGAEAAEIYGGWERAGTCDDGFIYTAPVGHYRQPNGFGLEDMVGNAWEWVSDCYVDRIEAPANTQTDGDCEKRVLRGGGWDYSPLYLRTAYRGAWPAEGRFANFGFRVARDR
ncbi:hypothetical protein ABI59_16910 [Acidobacteria bacterium Mor1]|nr:hypothetical protein ABI59_16910 [Acidobacteria bacterium Mor1]